MFVKRGSNLRDVGCRSIQKQVLFERENKMWWWKRDTNLRHVGCCKEGLRKCQHPILFTPVGQVGAIRKAGGVLQIQCALKARRQRCVHVADGVDGANGRDVHLLGEALQIA